MYPCCSFDLWALYGPRGAGMVRALIRTRWEAEMAKRARKGRARKKKKANHGKRPVSR